MPSPRVALNTVACGSCYCFRGAAIDGIGDRIGVVEERRNRRWRVGDSMEWGCMEQ
jgi:hypothetical protein